MKQTDPFVEKSKTIIGKFLKWRYQKTDFNATFMIFFNLKMFCFSFQCQFFSFYMSGDDLESSIMISAPNVVFHLKEEERKKERERERKKKERKRERERERERKLRLRSSIDSNVITVDSEQIKLRQLRNERESRKISRARKNLFLKHPNLQWFVTQ